METRKLQRVSGGTFTVSIPKEWATEHGLEAGREMYLNPHTDGSLVLQKTWDGKDKLASVTIDVGSQEVEYVNQALIAAYRVGYESITLLGSANFDDTVRERLESTVADLIGMELIERPDAEITTRCLLDPSEVSLRQSVVQLQFITSITLESAISILLGVSNELGQIRSRETEADRIFAMIDRHFTRSLIDPGEIDKLNSSRLQLFQYYAVAQRLREIIRIASLLGTIAKDRSLVPDEELPVDLQSICERSRIVVERASNAFIETDSRGKAIEALGIKEELESEIESVQQAIIDFNRMNLLLRVLDQITQILDNSVEIAFEALQKGYNHLNR